MFSRIGFAAIFTLPAFVAQGAEPPPKTWIDPDTGHRVVRLTDEPNSASLYFNQNGYSADGRKMIYTTPNGISVLDLETHAAKPIVTGRVRVIVTGRKTQNVYYIKDGAVFATNADTGASREIAKMPQRNSASIVTVNADETLLAGTYIETDGADYNANRPPAPQQLIQPLNKGQMMEATLAAHLPRALFTICSQADAGAQSSAAPTSTNVGTRALHSL